MTPIFQYLIACLIPITLTITDLTTNEPLIGVKITTQSQIYYTNFEGQTTLSSNDTIQTIEYISYRTQSLNLPATDTIIKLTY